MIKLQVTKEDITKVKVEVIVNAAKPSLMGGGGVDGAIHLAGGPAILADCKRVISVNGKCKTGEAIMTSAGDLPAKYVVHTVGTIWQGDNKGERQKLASCYSNALKLAIEFNCRTIAFPNISTGIYGYPKKEAAKITVETVCHFLNNTERIDTVVFVCFDLVNYDLMQAELSSFIYRVS